MGGLEVDHKKVITTLITSMLFISSSGGLVAAASTPANSGKPATNNSATTKKQQTTTTNKVVHTLAKVPAVKVTARSTVKLTDVNILSQDDGNTVTYTLTYKNNDSTPMMMLDYWSKVKTKVELASLQS